jgi:hypothetical protein
MNDQDYIRKAVELADGWWFYSDGTYRVDFLVGTFTLSDIPQGHQDALAAQLVRQVDAAKYQMIIYSGSQSEIYDVYEQDKGRASGPDTTMNTIKAIVDSNILHKKAS